MLRANHPDWLTRDQLSDLADVTKGGTFSGYLSNLRTNGLIDERGGDVRLSDTLFLAEAA